MGIVENPAIASRDNICRKGTRQTDDLYMLPEMKPNF